MKFFCASPATWAGWWSRMNWRTATRLRRCSIYCARRRPRALCLARPGKSLDILDGLKRAPAGALRCALAREDRIRMDIARRYAGLMAVRVCLAHAAAVRAQPPGAPVTQTTAEFDREVQYFRDLEAKMAPSGSYTAHGAAVRAPGDRVPRIRKDARGCQLAFRRERVGRGHIH